jgi:hypothetical protein
MSYRNKTYVIFSSNDINYYNLMCAWKENENVEFDFNDAHDIGDIREDSQEETIKRRLRERFSNSRQVIVLIGEDTRYKYKYVRWEIEVAQDLDLPIIAVNINDKREMDPVRCPTILKGKCVLHVSFNLKIVQYALDMWEDYYKDHKDSPDKVDLSLKNSVYDDLGL